MKRIVLIGILVIALALTEALTEQSMFVHLPDDQHIDDNIASMYEQAAPIDKSLYESNEEAYLRLFDNSVRHTFIVRFTHEEWNGMIEDMKSYHDSFGSYRSNNYRKVDITYRDDDKEVMIHDVGFRSKGSNYSRDIPLDDNGSPVPFHFMLKFNETFDYAAGSTKYDLLRKRDVFELENLYFKWNNQEDASYSNELYAMQLMENAGVIVPRSSFAEVQIWIDDALVINTLYHMFEDIDDEFLKKRFTNHRPDVGNLYKVIHPGSLHPITDLSDVGIRDWAINERPTYGLETNTLNPDYWDLITFSYISTISDPLRKKLILNQIFDIDRFLEAMAVNVLIGNPDDYRGNLNNYYLYFDKNGQATYIPYDLDNSMGSGWGGEPAFIDHTLGNDIYTWGHFINNPRPILWDTIVSYEEYRVQFENNLMDLIEDGQFSAESYHELVHTAQSLYGNLINIENDKTYFIGMKTSQVIEDVYHYRNQRTDE